MVNNDLKDLLFITIEAIDGNVTNERNSIIYAKLKHGGVECYKVLCITGNEETDKTFATNAEALEYLYTLGYTYFCIHLRDGTTSNYVDYNTIRQLV